jgi:hypothetical protein
MAIEAARQRAAETGTAVSGYELRQINVSQALVIPEPSGQVEAMLCMKQYPERSKVSSSTWDEFFVYSASEGGERVEHCRGPRTYRCSEIYPAQLGGWPFTTRYDSIYVFTPEERSRIGIYPVSTLIGALFLLRQYQSLLGS